MRDHCTMCCLYSIFSSQPRWDMTSHLTIVISFNIFSSQLVRLRGKHLRDFRVFYPTLCLNTWEFYYPPVSYTGGFWTQGDPTVQCAHCAMLTITDSLHHSITTFIYIQTQLPRRTLLSFVSLFLPSPRWFVAC